MLTLALQPIKDILESLEIGGTALIHKYGGLTFPISIPEEIGKTDGGESILKTKTFPIAAGVTFEECMGQRAYQELTPNSKYRSIAYFEQLGDATINAQEGRFAPKGGLVVYDIPVRLVFWGNLKKLNINGDGATEFSMSAPISIAIQNALFRRGGFSLNNAAYEHATVEFIFAGQELKDATKVFGRYTYGDLTKFMLAPYDWFSLRYTVRLRINRNCVETFTIGSEIECNTSYV